MSTIPPDSMSTCDNCGKEGSNHLKACTACKLVKYCNRECQKKHRPMHKKECRRRAAELHEEELFKQPQSEDCPICFIRMPTYNMGWKYQTCCGKVICSGCCNAPSMTTKAMKMIKRSVHFVEFQYHLKMMR